MARLFRKAEGLELPPHFLQVLSKEKAERTFKTPCSPPTHPPPYYNNKK
jgi:hypothetical protein